MTISGPHLNVQNRTEARQDRDHYRYVLQTSVTDPDPDPYVFGPNGSGFISTRYGSESFYNQ
jgi:hypothetical protein